MFKKIRSRIAQILAPEVFEDFRAQIKAEATRADDARLEANRRYAEMIMQMDPLEPLMRRFNGIFTEEFDHPEDKLDAGGAMRLKMWGYQQKNDPAFLHMIAWVMNSAGNETIKRAPITNERTQYGRAQISNMILLRDEVGRLASAYEEELERRNPKPYDIGVTVE